MARTLRHVRPLCRALSAGLSGAALLAACGDGPGPQRLGEDPGMPGWPQDAPAVTRAYVAGLQFVSGVGQSQDSAVLCSGGRVRLRIQPEARVRLFVLSHVHADPAANRPTANGRLVARITNVDQSGHTCDDFQLAPAEYAYWWIAEDKVSHEVTSAYFKIDPATGAAQEVATAGTTAYRANGAHDRALAAWRDPDAPSIAVAPLSAPAPRAGAMMLDVGTWISCDLGCCVAGSITALR